jgi:NAD(P)-dependent dehydrogenase (short-subunit alcohol dehydrogenase family)
MTNIFNLDGKTALITGATGNLGRRISVTLAQSNVNLILTDINLTELKNLKIFLEKSYSVNIQIYKALLEKNIERNILINKVIKNNSRLDILINNAAYVSSRNEIGWSTEFENQTLKTWNEALEINLTAPFHLCQKLYPLLKKSQGTIINIGSIYGVYGPDWSLYKNTKLNNVAAYGVSKAGLIHLTKWLSKSISPEVRVNTISPGGIIRGQDINFIKRYEKKTPLKRMANEDDFIGAVLFLSSDMSKYMTGQNLIIDGGWGV